MYQFGKRAISDAEHHALDKYPDESCGVIIGDKYYPTNNVASDKQNTFRISPQKWARLEHLGEIDCVIHSHADYPHASKADMISQQKQNIPFGLVDIRHKSVIGTYIWGDTADIPPLLGRPFVHGIWDCYALARDYYRLSDCWVGDYPREFGWWNKGEDIILDNITNEDFEFLDPHNWKDIKVGDGILMKIKGLKVNHCAVYIGRGLILHHMYGELSSRQPLVRYRDFINYRVRHRRYK